MCERERRLRDMVLVDVGEDYVWVCRLCRVCVLMSCPPGTGP